MPLGIARPAAPARPAGRRARPPHHANTGASGTIPSVAGGGTTFMARRPGIASEILIPSTGWVTITAGAINVFGAWTPVTAAGVANDTHITQLAAARGSAVGLATALVEFAYGAAKTPLDAVRWDVATLDPAADDAGYLGMCSPGHFALIPAGQQLFARARDSKIAACTYDVYCVGFEGAEQPWTPLDHDMPAGAGRYYPTNITALTPTAALLPSFGAYITVIDPAPNDLLVTTIVPTTTPIAQQSAPRTAYKLGIGAPGAEQQVAIAATSHGQNPVEINPPIWVKGGERLALAASSTAAGARSCLAKVYDL